MVAALERIGWAGEVIAGMVNDNDHVDNGNNSVLHPLTILHFSTGVADHYTIQSSWIQSLFLRKLGQCQDEALNNLARAMFHADTKQKVKAAMQVAFGRGVSLDNLNFYPADGAVVFDGGAGAAPCPYRQDWARDRPERSGLARRAGHRLCRTREFSAQRRSARHMGHTAWPCRRGV
jgi:hypothetical protein